MRQFKTSFFRNLKRVLFATGATDRRNLKRVLFATGATDRRLPGKYFLLMSCEKHMLVFSLQIVIIGAKDRRLCVNWCMYLMCELILNK